MPSVANSTTSSPASRPDFINQLILGVDRYNPSNVALLEEYLESQVREGHYDLFANLAILKLYQFNPGLSSPHIVVQILLLSLTSSTPSSSDFSLSLALALDRPPPSLLPGIPIPSEDDEDDEQIDSTDYVGQVVDVLNELEKLLRECRFREFWKVWTEGGGEGGDLLRTRYIPQHPHILTSLRFQISSTISSSFSRISTTLLEKWLNLSSEIQVKQFVENVDGWSLDGGVEVVIAGNGDNDVKPGVIRESVDLKQLTKLVAAANY